MRVCKYVLTLLNESTKNVCLGPKIKLTSMCVQSTFICCDTKSPLGSNGSFGRGLEWGRRVSSSRFTGENTVCVVFLSAW